MCSGAYADAPRWAMTTVDRDASGATVVLDVDVELSRRLDDGAPPALPDSSSPEQPNATTVSARTTAVRRRIGSGPPNLGAGRGVLHDVAHGLEFTTERVGTTPLLGGAGVVTLAAQVGGLVGDGRNLVVHREADG